MREGLTALIESVGLSVQAFGSGPEFLGAYIAEAAACVILDWNMPGMNGLAVLREIEASGNNLPVIFLSGSLARPATIPTAQFLTKPVLEDELMIAIRQAFESNRRARFEKAAGIGKGGL